MPTNPSPSPEETAEAREIVARWITTYGDAMKVEPLVEAIATALRPDPGLREALEELVAACEAEFETDDHHFSDDEPVSWGDAGDSPITFGMIRRGRAALAQAGSPWRPIKITGAEHLDDGRVEIRFVWPFDGGVRIGAEYHLAPPLDLPPPATGAPEGGSNG